MSYMTTSDKYHKVLSVYRDRSTETAAISQWFREQMPTHISPALKAMQPEETLRVLGIASGPGDPDVELLDFLVTLGRAIQYTVVDPNAHSVGIFKNRVTKSSRFRDIEFKFYKQTIQSFMDGPDCRGPYHLIHIILSLYYFDDIFESFIQKCVNLLTTDGIFFSAYYGTNEGLMEVFKNNAERRFGPSRQMYLMKNMEKVLEEFGIRFSKDVYVTYIDVGFLLAGQSEEADLFLDGVTHVDDARKNAPYLVQSVIEDVKKEMISIDGNFYLKDLYCVYTMRRPRK